MMWRDEWDRQINAFNGAHPVGSVVNHNRLHGDYNVVSPASVQVLPKMGVKVSMPSVVIERNYRRVLVSLREIV